MKFGRKTSIEIFKKFFDITGTYEKRQVYDHTTNVRTSKKKDKLIDDTINELKSVGIRLSKNDVYNIAVDILLGIKQHGQNKNHFYFSKNEMSLNNFIEENREQLIVLVQTRLFEKQMEILDAPYKNSKDKKRRTQYAKRLSDSFSIGEEVEENDTE